MERQRIPSVNNYPRIAGHERITEEELKLNYARVIEGREQSPQTSNSFLRDRNFINIYDADISSIYDIVWGLKPTKRKLVGLELIKQFFANNGMILKDDILKMMKAINDGNYYSTNVPYFEGQKIMIKFPGDKIYRDVLVPLRRLGIIEYDELYAQYKMSYKFYNYLVKWAVMWKKEVDTAYDISVPKEETEFWKNHQMLKESYRQIEEVYNEKYRKTGKMPWAEYRKKTYYRNKLAHLLGSGQQQLTEGISLKTISPDNFPILRDGPERGEKIQEDETNGQRTDIGDNKLPAESGQQAEIASGVPSDAESIAKQFQSARDKMDNQQTE